jgi:hypothetical protein
MSSDREHQELVQAFLLIESRIDEAETRLLDSKVQFQETEAKSEIALREISVELWKLEKWKQDVRDQVSRASTDFKNSSTSRTMFNQTSLTEKSLSSLKIL